MSHPLTLEQRLYDAVDGWYVRNAEYIEGSWDSYMIQELKDVLRRSLPEQTLVRSQEGFGFKL